MSLPRKSGPSSFRPQVESLENRYAPSASAYITALYQNLLNRAPAAAEVSSWVTVLTNGATPGSVALAFVTSPEYRANVIREDYTNLLGRAPGPAETQAWLGAYQAGLSSPQIEAAILGSDEFYQGHGGSPDAWVDAVYHAALGRAAEPAAQFGWGQALQAGESRDAVGLSVLTSPEAATRFVTAAYQVLLGRAPDPAGLAAGVSALTGGATPGQVLAALASSPEYIARTAQGDLSSGTQPATGQDPTSSSDLPSFPTPYGFNSNGMGFTGPTPGGFIDDAGFSASD